MKKLLLAATTLALCISASAEAATPHKATAVGPFQPPATAFKSDPKLDAVAKKKSSEKKRGFAEASRRKDNADPSTWAEDVLTQKLGGTAAPTPAPAPAPAKDH